MLVTGPNTREAGLACDRIDGKGVVELTIDRMMLLPGTYDITVSLYDHAITHPYDFRQKVLRFDVEAGTPHETFGGVVSLGWASVRRRRRPNGQPEHDMSDQPTVTVLVDGRGADPTRSTRTIAAARGRGAGRHPGPRGAPTPATRRRSRRRGVRRRSRAAGRGLRPRPRRHVGVDRAGGAAPGSSPPLVVAAARSPRASPAVTTPPSPAPCSTPRPVDRRTGPSGLSHVGHPLAPRRRGVGTDEGPTFFLGRGVGGVGRRAAPHRRASMPASPTRRCTIDLGWRLWTSSAGVALDPELAVTGPALDPWAAPPPRRLVASATRSSPSTATSTTPASAPPCPARWC